MAKRSVKPSSVGPSNAAEAITTSVLDITPSLQKIMPGATLASNNTSEWTYVDFCDPKTGLPCLPLEYLFGMRGYLCGRVLKWEADEGVGKSSLSLLSFGMGQKTKNAWCMQLESEDAEMPENRIWDLGCDPARMWRNPVTELVKCFEDINTFTRAIRDTHDPNKTRPIMIVVDSISNLAENEMDDDILKKDSDASLLDQVDFTKNQPGKHARFLSQWFRNGGTALLKKKDVFLMLVGQLKNTIPMGPTSYLPPEKKTLGGAAVNFHSTFRVQVQASKLLEKEKQVGDTITMYTEKNKIAPRRKRVSFDLYTVGGFDLMSGVIGCLTQSHDGHGEKLFDVKLNGGWYTWSELSDKNMRAPDLAEKLYAHQDLLMSVRERMRIYGYGFDFEKKYGIEQAEADFDKTEAEEAVSESPK